MKDDALRDPASALRTSWLGEVRRRGVLRVATSYAVIAWLVVQIGDTTFEPLGVPSWVFPALIVTAALGFPVAILLAWFLELTPQGIERDTAPPAAVRPHVQGVRRYADIIIIAILLVVVAVLLTRDRIAPTDRTAGSTLSARTVAVLPFEDLSSVAQSRVLAQGIAETVLHQLASLHDIDVIARTSSFAFEGNEDVRVIGQKLNARYLLEGSVQSDGKRLRVMAQLVDAVDGGELWSLRFDRTLEDIFAVQDEIALQVARALRIALDPTETEKLTGHGTTNIDAYLEYVEARDLLASWRVTDMPAAIVHLESALRGDPEFADAYALLAGAVVRRAEYEVSDSRLTRFAEALDRAEALTARALELDADNAEAYIQRAYLRAFSDLEGAESDYRHGLELNPNSAPAHEGLAGVLFQDPLRRDETLEELDRARKLDPLEPRIDVLKSVALFFGPGRVEEAKDLLESVLERNPGYVPALARLAQLDVDSGEFAESARLATQVLALDPANEDARTTLINAYLDAGDPDAAERTAAAAPTESSARYIPVFLYRREWARAAEAAYQAYESETNSQRTEGVAMLAICLDARERGDYARAIATLELDAGVTWDKMGHAILSDDVLRLPSAEIGLAGLLLETGDLERAHSLLEGVLTRLDDANKAGRGLNWDGSRVDALALLGNADAAMTMLETRAPHGFRGWVYQIAPALDSLRSDPRFQRLAAKAPEHNAAERTKIERMRAAGELPSLAQD